LVPGQPYLIKSRPTGWLYEGLVSAGGLGFTNGWSGNAINAAYDKDQFRFDGSVYSLDTLDEQLFAKDNLPPYQLTGSGAGEAKNWVMGNSYTSAISIEKLKNYIGTHAMNFYSVFYVFDAGSQTYQPIDFRNINPTVWRQDEIPAMSVFMIRIPASQVNKTAEFKISKDMLVHSKRDFGNTGDFAAPGKSNAGGASDLNNQVIFRITTTENENNYDLAAIGLRSNASLSSDTYDMSKVYISGNQTGFQLYTLSAPIAETDLRSKLSANAVPLTVDSVLMNFYPSGYEPKTMILNVEGVETLSSEDFWLEDLKTKATHRFVNGEPYIFQAYPEDAQERFVVHFKAQPAPQNQEEQGSEDDQENETGTGSVLASKINMYAVDRQIFIENLLVSDMGAEAAIYDVAGKQVDTFKVTEYPNMTYASKGLVSGTYIMRLFRNSKPETMKLIVR
jgi:hypothetical protein